MRRSAGNPVEEFEELRRLLLSGEREQLRDLRDRISNKDRRSQDIAAVLPEAFKRGGERGDELSRALRPAVEGSIRQSIEARPKTFVDALQPIIGTTVRRSIRGRFRRLFQSRTLVYRVEQAFLLHRETNVPLLHVTDDSAIAKKSKTDPRMLHAIQGFARDFLKSGQNTALTEFHVGELQVRMEPGRSAYLAAVIQGEPPADLRTTFQETIERVHILNGGELAHFQGDASVFEPLRTELETCLRSKWVSKSSTGRKIAGWLVLAGATALIISALVLAAQSQARWRDFLRRLNAEPGIVVTEARKGWISPSQVTGLRDKSAVDPAGIAAAAKVDPKSVRFQWKDFLALDPTSVEKRFAARFRIPPETQVTITEGVVVVSGPVPYEWLENVRRQATEVPGVVSLLDRDANIVYDPASVVKRFQDKFGFPRTVRPALVKDVLILSGGASHAWLTQVRSEGKTIPGISAVEERNLIDLDRRALQQSKAAIQNAFIYFPADRDDITPEGFATLSGLKDQLRSCETAAEALNEAITLEIEGFVDSVEGVPKNADLSQRRAQKVRDFLLSCGFDSSRLLAGGTAASTAAAPGDTSPTQGERCVAFKVSSSQNPFP